MPVFVSICYEKGHVLRFLGDDWEIKESFEEKFGSKTSKRLKSTLRGHQGGLKEPYCGWLSLKNVLKT